MKVGKLIEIEDIGSGWTPVHNGVEYTDLSGARVFIPEKLLIRLYEGCKFVYEKHNQESQTWEEHCNSLFLD